MELRFLMGYLTGTALLAFLYRYDFEWYVVIIICCVVYVGMKTVAQQLFDK